MNAFEKKMAEQLALMTTLVMTINSQQTEFFAGLDYSGHINKTSIRFIEKVGVHKFSNFFLMETYLEERYQQRPPRDYCTIEQMIHTLNQVIKSLTEGRTHDTHNKGTITDLFATTGMDERRRTHGSLLTGRPPLRNGATERTGRQPSSQFSLAV